MHGSGSVVCAADGASMSKISPSAVLALWNCAPYQDAMPTF
jgi:hypothetical protein